MRKLTVALLGLALVGAFFVPTATAAAGPYCGITWGSLARSGGGNVAGPIDGVRTGQHACYDRLVVDLSGDAAGYRVRYVTAVTQDGSGNVVPLRGGAKLQIVVLAPAYDAAGSATFPAGRSELAAVSGYRTFRQVAGAGSFEGQTTLGLGVRARLPFRMFVLDGPGSGSRLVIDVAHRW